MYHKSIYLIFILLIPNILCNKIILCNKKLKENAIIDQEKKITIFIHGTLFALTPLIHWLDCPFGLNLATNQTSKYFIGKIPFILNKMDNNEFPLETFYLYGWSGKLNIDKRLQAAKELYNKIKKLKGKITIIGHSHGCNVAINLAAIALEEGDKEFKIDRLILIAPPVQKIYSFLLSSEIFKKIYSFYSTSDFIQILDPQKKYFHTRKLNIPIPFFSERIFDPQPNLIQSKIVINKRGPSHLDLMLERFLKHLPRILKDLEALEHKTDCQNFTIHINKLKKIF